MDVKYVVASEFDLDLGATVKYHYPDDPQPIFNKENGFANLLIPDQAHLRQEDWTFFFLYENTHTGELEYTPNDSNARIYYVCNTLQTKYGNDLKRGAQIFSLSLIAAEPYIHIFKPLLLLAIDAYITSTSVDRLAEVYNALKTIDMSRMPHFDWQEKRMLQLNQNQSLFRDYYLTKYNGVYSSGTQGSATSGNNTSSLSDTHFYDVVVNYRGLKIPLRIPTDVEWYNAGEFSLVNLMTLCNALTPIKGYHKEVTVYGVNTPPLLVLWSAILTGKKILFVGDSSQIACRELCDLVIACGYFGTAAGLLNTTTRVFPYVDLGRIEDLLKTDGYIAGVTNSAFLLHPEWWDLAIHIDKKKIELSSHMHRKVPERYPMNNPSDFEFGNEITALLSDRHAERAVRERSAEYTRQFLRRAAASDLEKVAESLATRNEKPVPSLGSFGYPWANQAERAQFNTVHVTVNSVWKRQPSFYFYLKQVADKAWPKPPKAMIDFYYEHTRLRQGNLEADQAATLYHNLCSGLEESKDITRFLAEVNSVYYLNLGLYHPDAKVRDEVCKTMGRIKKHTAGVFYYLELPPYHAIALERAERKQL